VAPSHDLVDPMTEIGGHVGAGEPGYTAMAAPATASASVADPIAAALARPPAPLAAQGRAARLLEGRGWTVTSLGVDAAMLGLALLAALVGADAADVTAHAGAGIWLFPLLVMSLMALRGMYRPRIQLRVLDDVARVVSASSISAMSIIAIGVFTAPGVGNPSLTARLWLFGLLYVAGGRMVLTLTLRKARTDHVVGTPTLIVGAGRVGAQVERRLRERPELGLEPVGFIDASPAPDEKVPGRRGSVLGTPDDLAAVVERTGARHVILAFLSSRGADAKMVPIVRTCEELGLQVSLVPRLFESINVRAELEHIGGMPLFRLSHVNPKGWQFAVKHTLDRVLAILLIVLLAPLLTAIALTVKLTSPGPVFFRQRRVGRDEQEFDLLKFRSMRMDVEPPAPSNVVPMPLPEDTAPGGVEGLVDQRTALGRLLRRTSLDELPQLFNVLKGEMSIVGPRPERPEFVELFERDFAGYEDRHRVRAGITGWAQVHGLRGKTSLSDRIEWDNYYIENWSLRLDLKILVMTVSALFQQAE
jgi:exopolysaccharide biosynthesis polyprenyl glycosylphosphotransferase